MSDVTPPASTTRRVAYVVGLPPSELAGVAAAFPDFEWKTEAQVKAAHVAPGAIKRFFSSPDGWHWLDELTPNDRLVYWWPEGAPAPRDLGWKPGPSYLLHPGPFSGDSLRALTLGFRSFALEPLAAGQDIGVPDEGPPIGDDGGSRILAVGSIGDIASCVKNLKGTVTGYLTRWDKAPDWFALRLEHRIAFVQSTAQFARAARLSDDVRTAELSPAIAARLLGARISPVPGEGGSTSLAHRPFWQRMLRLRGAELEAALANSCGFASGEGATVPWSAVRQLLDSTIGLEPAVDTPWPDAPPARIEAIVVGQPGRTASPFARLFGTNAWQVPADSAQANLAHLSETGSPIDLIIYKNAGCLPEWTQSTHFAARRIVYRMPQDYPLSLTLSDAHIPMFGMHRVTVQGGALRYDAASDIDALDDRQRAACAEMAQANRHRFLRLQTARRPRRLNAVDMGRRFGPHGAPRILVLGQDPDPVPGLTTNADRMTDQQVIEAALAERHDAGIIYHPAAGTSEAAIKEIRALGARVLVADQQYSISELAQIAQEAWTVDSQLGIFALAAGLTLVVYGQPFYARLGATRDRAPDGRPRMPLTKRPVDTPTLVGWYFQHGAVFAHPFTGDRLSFQDFVDGWAPYLCEISAATADSIVEKAIRPTTGPADLVLLLRALERNNETERLARALAALNISELAKANPQVAFETCRMAASLGDWRRATRLSISMAVEQQQTAQLGDTLTHIRGCLSSLDEVEFFTPFLIGLLRRLPAATVTEIANRFRSRSFFSTALALYRTVTPTKATRYSSTQILTHQGNFDAAANEIDKLARMGEAKPKLDDLRLALMEAKLDFRGAAQLCAERVAAAPTKPAEQLRHAQNLRDSGRLDEARVAYLGLVSSNLAPQAITGLIGLHLGALESQAALAWLEFLLEDDPRDAALWRMRAHALSIEGRLDEACDALLNCIKLNPRDIASHTLLTAWEAELRTVNDGAVRSRSDDYLAFLEGIDEHSEETLIGLGRAALQTGDTARLEGCARRAAQINPFHSEAHAWLGHALAWGPQPASTAEIRSAYETAVTRDPEHAWWAPFDYLRAFTHLNDADAIRKAMPRVRKRLGGRHRYRTGNAFWMAGLALAEPLRVFEGLRDTSRTTVLKKHANGFDLALKLSEVGENKKVLLLSEGGPGDELRYATLYRDLLDRFPDAVVTVDERLEGLFRRSFRQIGSWLPLRRLHSTHRFERQRSSGFDALPDVELAQLFDNRSWALANSDEIDVVLPVQCTAADLRRDLNDYVGSASLRLLPKPDLSRQWAERLKLHGDGLLVGIIWTSLLDSYQRGKNYVDLSELTEALSQPGVVPVSLQYQDVSDELEAFRARTGVTILDFADLDKKDDFEGVAALVSNLDLVIGVNTAMSEFTAMVGCETLYVGPTKAHRWRDPQHTGRDIFFPERQHLICVDEFADRAAMFSYIAETVADHAARKRTHGSRDG